MIQNAMRDRGIIYPNGKVENKPRVMYNYL